MGRAQAERLLEPVLDRVDGDDRLRARVRAAWTANWPTAPAPSTTTEEPGSTRAANSTALRRSGRRSRAARPRGAARPPPRGARPATRRRCARRGSPWPFPGTRSPRAANPVVPSTRVPFPESLWSRVQAAGRPRLHSAHSPHEGAQERTTSSPGASPRTSLPTASTTPAPSCPSTMGVGRRNSPLTLCRSVPQIPAAAMRTTTSSGPGSASSSSSTVKGFPGPQKTAARVVIGPRGPPDDATATLSLRVRATPSPRRPRTPRSTRSTSSRWRRSGARS